MDSPSPLLKADFLLEAAGPCHPVKRRVAMEAQVPSVVEVVEVDPPEADVYVADVACCNALSIACSSVAACPSAHAASKVAVVAASSCLRV